MILFSIRACPSFNVARVGIVDRPFSRGLYPAAERVMEPASKGGGGHLALVIKSKSGLIYFSKESMYDLYYNF